MDTHTKWTLHKTVRSPDLEGLFSYNIVDTLTPHQMLYNTPYSYYLNVLLFSPCLTGTKALCCKHSEKPVWEKVGN